MAQHASPHAGIGVNPLPWVLQRTSYILNARVLRSAFTEIATTDSAEALRDMALAGLGIIRVSAFIVTRDIAEGRLVVLLEDAHVSEEVPVWAVMAPGRHRLPRVQVFVDFLARNAADW